MDDPFAIPDVIGHEDEADGGHGNAAGSDDPFAIPDVLPDQPEGAAPESHGVEDALLGLLDGVTLNHAGEIGNAASSLMGLGGEKDVPEHEIFDGMAPTYAGERVPDMESLYSDARKSLPGQIGHGVGLAGAGIGAAVAAGPGIATQGLTGAATGGLSAAGDADYDPLSSLAGAGVGGAFGLAGGALGKGVDAVRKWLGSSAEAGQGVLPGMKATTNADKARGAFKVDPFKDSLSTIGSKVAKSAALGAASSSAGHVAAYAGMPTLSWGVQSVLSSGRSKLPPEAEQQLTEAVLSGDDNKVIATNFKLQQRYPGYAKRLQDEIDSLNNGA